MNIFERALRAINPGGFNLGNPQTAGSSWQADHPSPDLPGWRWPIGDRDYRNSINQAKLSSLVEAAVGYRADNAASTPWILLKRDGSETLTEHPVLDILNRPNPHMDGRSFGISLWRDLDIRGNGYALKVNSVVGETLELWQRSSMMLKPITDKNGMLIKYQYKVQNEPAVFYDPEEVIHIRYPDPDAAPWIGRSPLEAAGIEIYLDRESGKFQADALKNGVAGLLLMLESMPEDERPTDDELAALREYIKGQMGGRNRGELLLADFPLKSQNLEYTPEQLMLKYAHNYAEERIAGIYKLPTAVIQMRLEGTTANATLREWERQAWHASIMPTQDLIAEQISHQLLPDFMDDAKAWKLGHDRSQVVVLQTDDVREGTIWAERIRAGAATLGEWRAAIDLSVEPEHEIYLVPRGYDRMTLDELGDTTTDASPFGFGFGATTGANNNDDNQDDEDEELEDDIETDEPTERSIRATRGLMEDFDREEIVLRAAYARQLEPLFKRLGRIARNAYAANVGRAPTRQLVATNGHSTRDTLDDEALLLSIMNSISTEIEEIQGEFKQLGETHYGRVLRSTIGSVDASLGLVINMPDPVMEEVIRLGGTRAGLVDLNEQTRRSIFEALGIGRANGEGADELGRRIRDMVGAGRYTKAGAPYRARMIARTETKFAQGISSHRTYEAGGITHVRLVDDQLGYGDEECAARDGKVVTLDEYMAALQSEHPNFTLRAVPLTREQVASA